MVAPARLFDKRIDFKTVWLRKLFARKDIYNVVKSGQFYIRRQIFDLPHSIVIEVATPPIINKLTLRN